MPTPEDIQRWEKMLVRGQVPPRLRGVSQASLAERVQRGEAASRVLEYLKWFPTHRKAGRGLFLCGGPHTGKTTAAVVVLKYAVMQGFTVLFTDAERARGAFYGREMFDADSTMHDRMQGVDVLCITHLGQEKNTDDFAASLASLLRFRSGRSRPTVFTSYLFAQGVGHRYGVHTASALSDACVVVRTSDPTPEE